MKKYPNQKYETGSDYDKWKQVAIKNNIHPQTFYTRFRELGWSLEKSATTPTKKTRSNKWVKIARENGVNYKTYYQRVYSGWSEEKAATIPPKKRKQKTVIYAIYRGDEYICDGTKEECAEKLGVTPDTVYFYSSDVYKERIQKNNRANADKRIIAERIDTEYV